MNVGLPVNVTVKKGNIEPLGKINSYSPPSCPPDTRARTICLHFPVHLAWVDFFFLSHFLLTRLCVEKIIINSLYIKEKMVIEKMIYLLSLGDFCANGSSEWPLLSQMMGVQMHKEESWGDLGCRLELAGSRGHLGM